MKNISYIIKGGIPIYGRILCTGAKNLATKAMVASLLSNEITVLRGVPNIGDVDITKQLLISAGVKVECKQKANTMSIDAAKITRYQASSVDITTNRVPILLLSILLHRFGKASVPIVGGDNIGTRNVNYHIEAIKKFGAEVFKEDNKYIAYSKNKLKACHIDLPYPSVGATETCLFLSVLAKGTSIINNIAIEPEIIQLIIMLRSMGASISFNNKRKLIINGVERLSGTNFFIVNDRIEAASWACLACASNGKIEVSGINPNLLKNFLPYFSEIGGGFKVLTNNAILFFRKRPLRSTKIETDVYPGFSTDLQQPFVTILTQAHGTSIVHETVHEKRFEYLHILNRLGAMTETVSTCLGPTHCRYKNQKHLHSAIIYGPTKLQSISKPLKIPDLRAGLAYLVAAVLSHGETKLDAGEQIERGYGNLVKKLKDTNIQLTRIQN